MDRDVRSLLESTALAFTADTEIDYNEILGESVCETIEETLREGTFAQMFNAFLIKTSISSMDCSEMLQEAEGDGEKQGKIKEAKDKFVKFIQDAWKTIVAMVVKIKDVYLDEMRRNNDTYKKFIVENRDKITVNYKKFKDMAIEGYTYDNLVKIVGLKVDALHTFVGAEFEDNNIDFPYNAKDVIGSTGDYEEFGKLPNEKTSEIMNNAFNRFAKDRLKSEKMDSESITKFIKDKKVAKIGDLKLDEIIKVLEADDNRKKMANQMLEGSKMINNRSKKMLDVAKKTNTGDELNILKKYDKIERSMMSATINMFNVAIQMHRAKVSFYFKAAKMLANAK